MASIRIKGGTRAQLNAAKTAGELRAREPYFITDEGVLAVGTGTNAYVEFVVVENLPQASTEAEMEAGEECSLRLMSPLNIAQAISALAPAAGVPAGGITSSGLTMATAKILGRTAAEAGAVEELPLADFVRKAVSTTLVAGYSATSYDSGTKSSGTFTPDAANGNQQHCVNGGSFALAPPANATTILLEITNNSSAGAITTSGFTKVVGSFATTNGHKFICNIVKSKSYSLLQIQELQ